MKFSIMLRIITLICLGNTIVEGCLRKSANPGQADANSKLFRESLKECYTLQTDYSKLNNVNLHSTIDFFVLHSRFVKELTEVGAACDTDKTSTCWKAQLKKIVPEYTILHKILSDCFDSTEQSLGADDTRVRREITMESKVRSRRTPQPDNSKMFNCPELTTADFKTKFDASQADFALSSDDLTSTDESLSNIRNIAEVFIKYIRCPTCTCTSLATSDFNVDDQTDCEHCWYARLAAATEPLSPFRGLLVAIALRQQQSSSIVCVPSAIITVNHDEIKEMEIPLETQVIGSELYLGKHPICSDGDSIPAVDTDCFADASTGFESKKVGKFVMSATKREKCQREVTVADGKLKFTYVVTKVPTIDTNKPVTRYTCASKTFVCELPISQAIDITPHPITPVVKHITSDETTGTSHYRLSFALTGGDSSIEVNSDIAATITLENVLESSTYQLVAGKCWATPTDNHDYDTATIKYDLIDCFGCKADPTDDAVTVTTNRDSNQVVFSVKSFTWTSNTIAKDAQFIYIHCEVKVYDSTTSSVNGYTPVADCTNKPGSCPTNRFRRGINMEDSHLLSFGPITPFHKRQGQMLD